MTKNVGYYVRWKTKAGKTRIGIVRYSDQRPDLVEAKRLLVRVCKSDLTLDTGTPNVVKNEGDLIVFGFVD